MTVYVDDLHAVLNPSDEWRWSESCHLWADTVEELHAFAAKIGMRRSWFQDRPRFPHYDLTMRRRDVALQSGAVYHNLREWILKQRRARPMEPADG